MRATTFLVGPSTPGRPPCPTWSRCSALSFPLSAFYSGGRLLMRAIEPFRAGHVVTLQRRGDGGPRHAAITSQVGCTVRGTNQLGSLVCLAEASLNLPLTEE